LAFFGGILVVTFLSRVPFLDAGYGRINDAWRVATAAREIATSGRYTASRFPPHPVQEIVCSLFWRGWPVASNAATAVLSAFAVLFFALSLARLGIDGVLEASAALAFAPVIFINSTSSLDYLWALAFILGSLFFVLDRKPILAGIFLGLAIGCRITSGAMLLPLLILVWRTLAPEPTRTTPTVRSRMPKYKKGSDFLLRPCQTSGSE
jgi:membrane-bound ClpP family serine protease